MVKVFLPAIALAGMLAGFGQGAAAPTYDARFDLQQGSYTGVATFAVDRKGVVTGNMELTQPIGVKGKLTGEVKDNVWTFEFPYEIAQQNCTGVVKGTAKVSADRKTVNGNVTIGGACVQEPTPATFTFTQQPKK